MYHVRVLCLRSPEEGAGSIRTGLQGCKPLCACWELNLGRLEESLMLFNTKPSFKPRQKLCFFLQMPIGESDDCGHYFAHLCHLGFLKPKMGLSTRRASLRISRKLQGLNHCEASTTPDSQLSKASHFLLKSLSSSAVICAASTVLNVMVKYGLRRLFQTCCLIPVNFSCFLTLCFPTLPLSPSCEVTSAGL